MKLKQLKFTLLATFFLFTIKASFAQNVLINGDHIFYNSQKYTDKQLDSTFSLNPNAYSNYLEYKRLKDSASDNKTGSLLLGVGAVGSIFIIKSLRSDNIIEMLINYPIIIGTGVLGGLAAIGSGILFANYQAKYSKAIRHLNTAMDFTNNGIGSLEREQEQIISIGTTNNGIGISYIF